MGARVSATAARLHVACPEVDVAQLTCLPEPRTQAGPRGDGTGRRSTSLLWGVFWSLSGWVSVVGEGVFFFFGNFFGAGLIVHGPRRPKVSKWSTV